MNRLFSIISSMQTMAILMLIFAFAIAYATFIENDYGTMTAKADIFNAKWFEVLLTFLTLNLILNIFKYKMFDSKKIPILIFHVAFIVIFIGAAITRYFGYEGMMHIREGESSEVITSADNFFSVSAKVGEKMVNDSQIVYLSKRSSNTLESSLEIDSKKVDVELLEYIPDATESVVKDEKDGVPTASMMITGGGQGKPISLQEGEYYETNDAVLDFNSKFDFAGKTDKPIIAIFVKEGELFMSHAMAMSYLKMDDRSSGELPANENEQLAKRTLFSVGSTSFVLREFMPKASMKIVSNPNAKPMRPGVDAFKFKVTVNGESEELMIFGQAGVIAEEKYQNINGVDVDVSYGAKEIKLPFSLHLRDFQLDRYPGSMSPSSYASEVTLIDEEENINMEYRIFMNNILEHRGFRFFQSSYDKDELGTVLSVNNDPGTLPSYIGYTLLAIGMFWSLFSRRNRFAQLAKKASKARESKAAALLLTLGLVFNAVPSYATELDPALKTILSYDKAHAKKFGELIVQDSSGRMKPMDTLTTEVLAKVHRGSSLQVGSESLSANQVVLGMMITPGIYKQIKLIRTKNKEINKIIETHEDAKHASFAQFFEDPDNIRGYKLAPMVEAAVRKEAKYRDKFDKEVLNIDERVNVAYMIFTGSLMKIWPKKADDNNKWLATIESLQSLSPKEAEGIRKVAVDYFTSVDQSLVSGSWEDSNSALDKIAAYQKEHGAAVYPTQNRIAAEVFYNQAKIFERLYPLYLLVGFALLILSFVKILRPSFNIDLYTKAVVYIMVAFFIAHTIGLANRWYISGHAPWSNGYESMIYIAWATVLAGFIFSKRSSMTMAATGVLAGLILFVAHLNWMNPQVTNLVPVLNSYWLSIHVSMITASYGFLALGALLGFVTIILFILKTKKNEKHISYSIKELNSISEMSIMVGLVLLTVGNFLGGVWANESWGRYWGWDPKETWALVTILVYAVVLHIRFIKPIYSDFNFSVLSLLSFTSVLMTYFGVNYYLAGLHSYAKGDPVPVPDFVPITYFIIFLAIALAFRNRKLV